MTHTAEAIETELMFGFTEQILAQEMEMEPIRQTCNEYGLHAHEKLLTDEGRVGLIQMVAAKEYIADHRALLQMAEYEKCLARER